MTKIIKSIENYSRFLIPAMLLAGFSMSSCVQEKQDAAGVFTGGHWTDLTWSFDKNTVYWPKNVKFKHDTVFY